jgi:hypothetical protein
VVEGTAQTAAVSNRARKEQRVPFPPSGVASASFPMRITA